MALVLPILRIWLLLLNIYGTFKAMKPPPASIRSRRGPSGRALQLRKRELKSRLAVWIVWAAFCILESPLDRTIGFVTPFYNEAKCVILMFSLVARAHGAEAIFLHVIHPFLRPYVPAIDEINSALYSVLELLVLVTSLPWEFARYWWFRYSEWGWQFMRRSIKYFSEQDSEQTLNSQLEVDITESTTLQSQITAAPSHHDATTMGPYLRTRKRVLDQNEFSRQSTQLPAGSKSTTVHHIDSVLVAQLAQGVTTTQQKFGSIKTTAQPETSCSAGQRSYEIWFPPLAAFESEKFTPSPPRQVPNTLPSPTYPPCPAAYPLTPKTSQYQSFPAENPPPIPPIRKRNVGGSITHDLIDYSEYHHDQPQAGPSTLSSVLGDHSHGCVSMVSDGFHQALDPTTQADAMDIDIPIVPTEDRDGFNANKESIGLDIDVIRSEGIEKSIPKRRRRRENVNVLHDDSKNKKRVTRSHDGSTSLRRSMRFKGKMVERDEFGFTINLNRNSVDTISSSDSSLSTSHQKVLACTTPALKPTVNEVIKEDSSDEDTIRKRRKVKSKKSVSVNMNEKDMTDVVVESLKSSGTQSSMKTGSFLEDGSQIRYRTNRSAIRMGGTSLTESKGTRTRHSSSK